MLTSLNPLKCGVISLISFSTKMSGIGDEFPDIDDDDDDDVRVHTLHFLQLIG